MWVHLSPGWKCSSAAGGIWHICQNPLKRDPGLQPPSSCSRPSAAGPCSCCAHGRDHDLLLSPLPPTRSPLRRARFQGHRAVRGVACAWGPDPPAASWLHPGLCSACSMLTCQAHIDLNCKQGCYQPEMETVPSVTFT